MIFGNRYTVVGMDKTMSLKTREEVIAKLRQRYKMAGKEHKNKLLNQAQELLGYHRKSAIRSLRAPTVECGPRIITGSPVKLILIGNCFFGGNRVHPHHETTF